MNITVLHILRILLGLLFLFSGLIKLFPIEPFEILLSDLASIPWTIAPYLARLIISGEILIGILLIVNIYPKSVLKISLFSLSIFSLVLIYMFLFREDISDCGCFGSLISLSPWQSLIKNFVLIILSYFIHNKSKTELKRFAKLLFIILILVSLICPFALNPPNSFLIVKDNNKMVGQKMDLTILSENSINFQQKLDTGRVIIAFFSPTCKYCKFAAMKISLLHKQNKNLPIIYCLLDNPEKDEINDFINPTKSETVPYILLPAGKFFPSSGSRLPAIYFVEKGIIKKKSGFSDLNPDEIIEFLNE